MGKRIGILTSGGDCAGLNAAVRAAVFRARLLGHSVIGIMDGTAGLLARAIRARVLTRADFDPHVMRLGGTILGTTNKGDPFDYPMSDGTRRDRSGDIIEAIAELQLDALIGIGGDGSLDILSRLAVQGGINFVGIPKTIDNDLGLTEISIGFDTAVAVATEALDRLQPTAASHDRIMVLEVMGRDAGHIALSAGIAGGADVILIPEIPFTLEAIVRKVAELKEGGRNFALVVVSEAVRLPGGDKTWIEYADGQKRHGGIGQWVADQLSRATRSEARVTVLGHVQRGASPTAGDRLMASAFGVHAVDLIDRGQYNRMVAWKNRSVIDVPLADAIKGYEPITPNSPLVHTARALGICLGDPSQTLID